MNESSNHETNETCPACGVGHLVAERTTSSFDYEHEGATLKIHVEDVPVRRCTRCTEVFSGPEASRLEHDAICRAVGMLTPTEIRRVRERFSASQADFSCLTGIGEATLSRWERGRLIQNKAMDLYLRLLESDPENVERLRRWRAAGPSCDPSNQLTGSFRASQTKGSTSLVDAGPARLAAHPRIKGA